MSTKLSLEEKRRCRNVNVTCFVICTLSLEGTYPISVRSFYLLHTGAQGGSLHHSDGEPVLREARRVLVSRHSNSDERRGLLRGVSTVVRNNSQLQKRQWLSVYQLLELPKTWDSVHSFSQANMSKCKVLTEYVISSSVLRSALTEMAPDSSLMSK